VAPAGAEPGHADPEGAVIGGVYGRGAAGPSSYAVLIDVHEIEMDRGKPAARPNCSPDDPAAANGGYLYTGWKIQQLLPVRLNTATVPGHLGDVTGVLQASWDAWLVDPAVPRVAVAGGSAVTKYTANLVDDILWARTGGSLATTYTWRWNDGRIESDVVFNKSVAWAHIADDGDGCNETGAAVYDVANIATHEFGHSYGMGHPGGRYETMYGYGYSGETLKRSPDLGDVEGISNLY
jgi:hypothetical protein